MLVKLLLTNVFLCVTSAVCGSKLRCSLGGLKISCIKQSLIHEGQGWVEGLVNCNAINGNRNRSSSVFLKVDGATPLGRWEDWGVGVGVGKGLIELYVHL